MRQCSSKTRRIRRKYEYIHALPSSSLPISLHSFPFHTVPLFLLFVTCYLFPSLPFPFPPFPFSLILSSLPLSSHLLLFLVTVFLSSLSLLILFHLLSYHQSDSFSFPLSLPPFSTPSLLFFSFASTISPRLPSPVLPLGGFKGTKGPCPPNLDTTSPRRCHLAPLNFCNLSATGGFVPNPAEGACSDPQTH